MLYPFEVLVLSVFFPYFFQTFELSVKLRSMHVLAYCCQMEVEFQTIVEKYEQQVNIYCTGVSIYYALQIIIWEKGYLLLFIRNADIGI